MNKMFKYIFIFSSDDLCLRRDIFEIFNNMTVIDLDELILFTQNEKIWFLLKVLHDKNKT